MLKAPATTTQWLMLSFIVFGCIVIKSCLIIKHLSGEFLVNILRLMLLPDNNKALLGTTNSQLYPTVPPLISGRRLHVLKILESINSLDSLEEENVHYDLPFKKNSNRKGKNVSFSDPLTSNEEISAFTSDDEDAIRFDEASIKFDTPGFE